MTDYNFKDGKVYEGKCRGYGRQIGNVKDGKIYDGIGSLGSGHQVGNVKDGKVYDGKSSPGTGHLIGKVSDFTINGIQYERDETIVAVYHFLIKKIF